MPYILIRVLAILLGRGIRKLIVNRAAIQSNLKNFTFSSIIYRFEPSFFWVKPEHVALLEHVIRELSEIPWGEAPVDDTQAMALYRQGHVALIEMSGDWSKAPAAARHFLRCPTSLAYTGVAEVIYALSYVSGDRYVPVGIAAAAKWTEAAIAQDPLQPEPWIERAIILTKGRSKADLVLAELALAKGRELAPRHSRLPAAESAYYTRLGNYRAAETALLRGLDYAKEGRLSPMERRALLNALAMNYDLQHRPHDALATYRTITTEFPEYAWGWHNASLALLRAGQLEEALRYSDTAISLMPFPLAQQTNQHIRQRLWQSQTISSSHAS